MANRYWVEVLGLGSGNWVGDLHWSETSGGIGGASDPTSDDNVFFDANSFPSGTGTVTVNVTANCKDMDWTGAGNNPTLAGSATLYVYGNVTIPAGVMVWSHTGALYSSSTILSNWDVQVTISASHFYRYGLGGTTNLVSPFTTTGEFNPLRGTVVTNGNAISCSAFSDGGTTAAYTLTLGNTVVTCASFSLSGTGGITITANTATINCSGNFTGGNITTYNIINLTGATSAVSGDFTCAQLNLDSATTQTITFTAGQTITVTTSAALSGSAGHVHMIVSSSPETAYTIALPSACIKKIRYVDITDCVATGARVLLDSTCTDSGRNVGLVDSVGGVARANVATINGV